MAMDCCGRFGKALLIGINILFFLLGAGLLVAGIVANVNVIADEVLPALNKVELAGNDLGNFFHLIPFNNETKEVLLKSLQENYIDESLSSTNDISNAWNYAFLKFNCCGVNRVQGTTNDFDLTPWCTTSGECQQTNAQIPRTCCVGVTESNYKSQAPADCYASVSKDYNTQGCYDRFQQLVQTSSAPVIGVAITVMVIELLGFVFCHCPM
ncbi:tetraspanin-9-like [Saccostrea echinata]|uniref:tetraspanin-9-like n=1 Tax=Saccostrea echinata TaxID=191078 RepID=UPI002A81902D|nr:tetraspanin-9-like [Saccostrea echinata]